MAAGKTWSIAGIILGALLMLAPVCGLLGTVLGMFQSFAEISAADGQPTPQAVSTGVEIALVSAALGILLFLSGVAVLVVSLVRYARTSNQGPRLP